MRVFWAMTGFSKIGPSGEPPSRKTAVAALATATAATLALAQVLAMGVERPFLLRQAPLLEVVLLLADASTRAGAAATAQVVPK